MSETNGRKRLPDRRHGETWHLRLNGMSLYIRSGEYADGTLGEFFLDLAKQGSMVRDAANAWAMSTSIALQHSADLAKLVDTFRMTRSSPCGRVDGHERITEASSIYDLVVRVLGLYYLKGRDDLADREVPEPYTPEVVGDRGIAGPPDSAREHGVPNRGDR